MKERATNPNCGRALLALLLLMGLVSAVMQVVVDTGAQVPPNNVPKTSWVSVSAMVSCPDLICTNPPLGSNFILTASCGANPETSTTFVLNTPQTISYICNSYASCRGGGTLTVQAALVDSNRNVLIQSTPTQTMTVFNLAPPNSAPVATWYSPPTMSGNVVSMNLKYFDIDDDPNTLTRTLQVAENGPLTSTGGWTVTAPFTSSHQVQPNTVLETATFTCANNPCARPLIITAVPKDPSGMPIGAPATFTFTANLPGPPVVVISPGPYTPTTTIIATATGTGTITNHLYAWIHMRNGVQISQTNQNKINDSTSSSTSSPDEFNCQTHGCLVGDEIQLHIISANGADQSAPFTMTPITIVSSNSEKPTIDITSPFEPADGIDVSTNPTITARATQTQKIQSTKHQYIWRYGPSGSLTQTDADRPLPGSAPYETTGSFACSSALCGDGLSLTVNSLDNSNNVIETSTPRVVRIKTNTYALGMPVPRPTPPIPKDNEPFEIHTYAALDIVSHIYTWQKDGGTVHTVTKSGGDFIEVQNGQGVVVEKYSVLHPSEFDCTPATCRGATFSGDVQAAKGADLSPKAQWQVSPEAPPLEYIPEVQSISGAGDTNQMLQELQTIGSTSVKKGQSYTVSVGQPANPPGSTFTKLYWRSYLNGAPLQNDYIPVNGGTLALPAVTLSTDGDVMQYVVYGENSGARSGVRAFSLSVALPSGIVTTDKLAGIGNGSLGGGSVCDANVWLGSWMPLITMGFGALVAVIALMYMIGTAFNNPSLLEWSKTEIGQALLGIALFTVIVFLLNLECSLGVEQFENWVFGAKPAGSIIQSGDTMRAAALRGIEWSLTQTHLTTVFIRRELGALNIRATFSMSATRLPGVGGNGFSFSPLSGDWTMMGSLQMLLNLNTTFVIAILFQYFSLAIFSSASGLFLFLVPIGLILRSMPYLRSFGGSLVAIGVGFYLLYPMFLAMIGLMLPPLYTGANDPYQIIGTRDVNTLVTSENDLTGTNVFYYFYSMPSLLKGTEGYESVSCGLGRCFYTSDLAPLYSLTALNFIRAILLPSAGLIVIVSLVRDLSIIFGEEVEASKLIQMV